MAVATGKRLSELEQGVLRATVEEGLLGDGIDGEGKDRLVPVLMGIYREAIRTGDFANAVQKQTKRLFSLLDAAVKGQLDMHSDNVQGFQRDLELIVAGKSSESREAFVREDLTNAIEDAQAMQTLAACWNAAVSAVATETELSVQELRVLDLARDVWRDSSESKDELADWAIEAFRSYLAAGCDEREIAKKVPRLLRILREHLASVADGERMFAKDERAKPSVPAEPEDAIREAEENATAADALLARMREAK